MLNDWKAVFVWERLFFIKPTEICSGLVSKLRLQVDFEFHEVAINSLAALLQSFPPILYIMSWVYYIWIQWAKAWELEFSDWHQTYCVLLSWLTGIYGLQEAYLHEAGWFIQDLRETRHGCWLSDQVTFHGNYKNSFDFFFLPSSALKDLLFVFGKASPQAH